MVILTLLLAVECEVPPWYRDPVVALRDSADLVVKGWVTEIRTLDRLESGAEVEVSLAVDSAWRSATVTPLQVTIGSWECGPNLDYGRTYLVGVRRNWYGQEHAAVTAFPYYQNREITELLDAETQIDAALAVAPESDERSWVFLIVGLAVGLAVGVVVANTRSNRR